MISKANANRVGLASVEDIPELPVVASASDVRHFSDASKFVTPLRLIDAFQQIRLYDMLVPTPTNTGSGGTSAGVAGDINQTSGSTANSTSTTSIIVNSITNTSAAGAGYQHGLDWTRPITLFFSFYFVSTTANGIFRIGLKASGFGQPAVRGVVLEFRGAAGRIWVVAHNGTTLTQTDTGVNSTDMTGGYMTVSGGVVSIYGRNNLLWSGAAGAPTTISNNFENNVVAEITNGTDAAIHRVSWVRYARVLGG